MAQLQERLRILDRAAPGPNQGHSGTYFAKSGGQGANGCNAGPGNTVSAADCGGSGDLLAAGYNGPGTAL